MKRALLIMLVLFSCGCTELCEGEFSDMGDAFGLCEEKTVLPTGRDVLTISKRVYPSTEVRSGETLDLILKVGYNGEKDVLKDVKATLFDWCEGATPDRIDDLPEGVLPSKDIRKGLYETFEWSVKMPEVSSDSICSLSYRLEYEDKATTIAYLDVYGYDEYYQKRSRGESVTSTKQTYTSPGPVKVEIDTGDEPFIVPEVEEGRKKIYVTVKKVGDGMLKKSEIKKMTITPPSDYDIDDKSDSTDDRAEEKTVEKDNFKVYGDSSERFSYELTTNKDLIYEQISIEAEAEYDYEHRGSVDITVKP